MIDEAAEALAPLAAGDMLSDTPAASTTPSSESTAQPPFLGGWICSLAYDVGSHLEPTVPTRIRASTAMSTMPVALLIWCPNAYVHDNLANRWWRVGDETLLPSIEQLSAPFSLQGNPASAYYTAPLESDTGRDAYLASVRRCVEYIHAGDVFQANIAHRLSAPFAGNPRLFFQDLMRSASPWYGAYLECDRGIIASASPELFLSFDSRSRRLVSRPMKGTRDASLTGGKADLANSSKDEAELTMIVDLMRNDLGRVCEFGSVRVDQARDIETHARTSSGSLTPLSTNTNDNSARASHLSDQSGVHQGVATVSGTLRSGLHIADAIGATFPPGSVTGAPKVRAMQIIAELERSPRGTYCGIIGYVSRSGDAQFSVAIRTAVLDAPATVSPTQRSGLLTYAVGAGVVADSVAASEWEETLVKAGVLRRVLGNDS